MYRRLSALLHVRRSVLKVLYKKHFLIHEMKLLRFRISDLGLFKPKRKPFTCTIFFPYSFSDSLFLWNFHRKPEGLEKKENEESFETIEWAVENVFTLSFTWISKITPGSYFSHPVYHLRFFFLLWKRNNSEWITPVISMPGSSRTILCPWCSFFLFVNVSAKIDRTFMFLSVFPFSEIVKKTCMLDTLTLTPANSGYSIRIGKEIFPYCSNV